MSTASAAHPQRLPLRQGDSALTLQQLLGLSLFQGLSRRAEARLRGKHAQGLAVLRHYRAGEVICRQGEPGWTAYYLLPIADRLWLRESQEAAAEISQARLAVRLGEVDAADASEYLPPSTAEPEAAEPEDLESLRQAVAFRPSADELSALRAERDLLAAGDRSEEELAASHSDLLALPAAEKRRRADALAEQDRALATKLQQTVECAERRMLAQVFVQKTTAPEKKPPPASAGRLLRLLGRPDRSPPRSAPTGEPAAWDETLVGTLHEGELFGELSCLYQTRRSATVRALRDCHVLEFLAVVLELLLTSEPVQAELNEVYRKRVLGPQLRGLPLFAHVADEAIELLRRGAEMISKQPGEVVYEEGAHESCLYLVRSGTLKIYSGSGERVLGYRSRGGIVGESELLSGGPRSASCAAYQHPRADGSERAKALHALRVELVRIDRPLFERVCARFPAFRRQVERNLQDSGSDSLSHPTQRVQGTSRFNDLGLSQGRKLMLIDLESCTLCGDCIRGCASVQDDGLPRLALAGPRFGKYLVPVSCRQCHEPVCLSGCPVGAIHHGAASEIVIEDWCIGCGLCAARCPYQAIELRSDADQKAVVCDQCATRPHGPECVRACPHDAAGRVDATAFFARARVV
ncbi:MAG: cyclic nucleotide-binding domain-containing protein [Myxococcales bacterium]|nr:cyclic nucleotide-binding domain-containing protein [Myxococcales bacterium]